LFFILFCFCFVFVFARNVCRRIPQKTELPASSKRQTHARSLYTSKSTCIVGSNLSSTRGIGEVSHVVHYVTIGNVILSLRAASIGGVISGDFNIANGRKSCGSVKREVQSHFIIYMNKTFLCIFDYIFIFKNH
jgi:hypothetical protein